MENLFFSIMCLAAANLLTLFLILDVRKKTNSGREYSCTDGDVLEDIVEVVNDHAYGLESIIGAFKEYESNYNELIKSSNLNSEYLMALSEYSEAIGEIVEMNLNKEEHPELEKLIDAKNNLDEVYAKIVKLCEERESGK